MPLSRCAQGPPLTKTKQTLSPSENVSDSDNLLLCAACMKEQLHIMSGKSGPDNVQSSYVNKANLNHNLLVIFLSTDGVFVSKPAGLDFP